ncbi:MAG: (2Fe-2S) ferredoxin domain-containing protein [Deltaproteobacteria bacterium]|nr:(2Fe-2S) ferredoxin domain-containing protein [Deltaproteobacteria bacterium]
MATQNQSPFLCHVFVCTNDRKGERKSCADGDSAKLRSNLKKEVGKRGWKSRVRVSKSWCMGLCNKGPNVMIYPQGIWFSEVSVDDLDPILIKVGEIVDADQ